MGEPAREDERFMAAALRLARRNLGLTSTNPSVGCIIVNKGTIVGRAVTAPGGRPHAETQALAEAGEKARERPPMSPSNPARIMARPRPAQMR